MARLLIVRHGNTFEANQQPVQVGAKSDLALTGRGREQAQDMAQYCRIAGILPAVITAGSLCRQSETAHIIVDQLGLKDRLLLDEPALLELDYGLWEGLTQDEISSRWPVEHLDWEDAGVWPDRIFGEREDERLLSLRLWLKGLSVRHCGEDTVLAVTSGGVAKLIFRVLFPSEWDEITRRRNVAELKVKTGHFCGILIGRPHTGGADLQGQLLGWNLNPAAE